MYPSVYFIGAQDHLQPFDHQLWAHCMLNESTNPPKFYPADFNLSATLILTQTFGITTDGITHENCRNIYLRLVTLINALLTRDVPICSVFTDPTDLDTDSDTNSDT